MPIRYCEFQPSQHRNKRTATLLFLDDEHDKHPMAICDVCSMKLKQMRPDSILRPLHEKKAKKDAAAAAPGSDEAPPAP
ncbi:MAG TPA: hypothetical protein VM889_11245 [Candidatus Thermoplasmatota archaeon]|nr:hypothetical protein [Candidatus Thermoplasmatota archaeon]